MSWFDDFDNASYPNLSDLGPLTQQGIALRASLEGRTSVLWLDEFGWAELVSTIDIAPGSTRSFGSLRPLAVSDSEVIFAGTLDLGNGNQSGFGLYAVGQLGGPSRLIVEPGDVNYAGAERGVIRFTNAYGVNNWTWIYKTFNATTWPLVADAIVPGTNVRFRSVGQISTNGPDMLFHGAANTDIHGIFLYRSGTITRIVGYGDTVDGGFVDGHSSTNQALSEAGAAIQLSFAFGSRAVYFADLRGFVPCPDLTNDGTVALGDLSILLANFGKTGIFDVYGDLDGDEDVDIADLALILSSFGTDCW